MSEASRPGERAQAWREHLGLTAPIIQAPMAGVSTPALAAAVSNAGGLGSLGVAAMKPDAVRDAIRQTRALTSQAFNVNVFCHHPDASDAAANARWLAYLKPSFERFEAEPPTSLRADLYGSMSMDEVLFRTILDERPPVLSFHFGLPSADRITAFRSAGIVLMATAVSLRDALAAQQAGIDAVVAQGIEAGGHRGVIDVAERDEGQGLLTLTRTLVRKLHVPVVAAGGIMDGAGVAAVLALGAAAAQMGTAFVGCPESVADAGYRSAMASGVDGRTTLTTAISGRPARGFRNALTDLGEQAGAHPSPGYPMTYDAGKAINAAAKVQGHTEYGAFWSGQGAALARVLPAADLVAALQDECAEAIEALQALA